MSDHRILRDCAAAGYPRVTCQNCNQQVIRQPFLSNVEWENMLRNFEARHGAAGAPPASSSETGPLKRWPPE